MNFISMTPFVKRILPESPRWLMLQGRTEEALRILRHMAEKNGGTFPEEGELVKLVTSSQKVI